MEQFGDIARQEYLAVGIRVALHPMADLATEPRWGRVKGTFGEDAALSSLMITAYIRGFQGKEIGPQSVACMTKHFPGGGPQKDGRDAHFSYGREQVYPGNNFDYHLIPFEAAFAAGTTQIMPYYSVPKGCLSRKWASASTKASSMASSVSDSPSMVSSAPTGGCSLPSTLMAKRSSLSPLALNTCPYRTRQKSHRGWRGPVWRRCLPRCHSRPG